MRSYKSYHNNRDAIFFLIISQADMVSFDKKKAGQKDMNAYKAALKAAYFLGSIGKSVGEK